MNYLSPEAQTLYEDDEPMDTRVDFFTDSWYGYYALNNPALGVAGIVCRDADDTVSVTVYDSYRESEVAWSKLF